VDLLANWHTTVDYGILDFGTSPELIALFLDLYGKLASGSEDKYDRSFTWLEVLLFRFKKRKVGLCNGEHKVAECVVMGNATRTPSCC
jgi:hypothetical protein